MIVFLLSSLCTFLLFEFKKEPNWVQYLFEERLGFNPVYAALEAMLDMRGRIAISQTQFRHDLFAG